MHLSQLPDAAGSARLGPHVANLFHTLTLFHGDLRSCAIIDVSA